MSADPERCQAVAELESIAARLREVRAQAIVHPLHNAAHTASELDAVAVLMSTWAGILRTEPGMLHDQKVRAAVQALRTEFAAMAGVIASGESLVAGWTTRRNTLIRGYDRHGHPSGSL
jgi:hypothetical protein